MLNILDSLIREGKMVKMLKKKANLHCKLRITSASVGTEETAKRRRFRMKGKHVVRSQLVPPANQTGLRSLSHSIADEYSAQR